MAESIFNQQYIYIKYPIIPDTFVIHISFESNKLLFFRMHPFITGKGIPKQLYLTDIKMRQLQQTPEVTLVKKEAIATETQVHLPVNPPTPSTQNITASQSTAAVQAYSKTPYFVSSPGGTDIHENYNPYQMFISPDISACQNNYNYYASQEVDPSSNMIVPFENQTQMVEQFEPTPYPYPMNIIQEEVPYPYDMVPYIPPFDDLQIVEEVEMGRYYYDPYFDDMNSSGSWSSLSSTSTRSRKRRKVSVKRANKKGGYSNVKGVKTQSNKDRKKTNEYSRRKRTDTSFAKIDISNSKRISTSHLDKRRNNKLSARKKERRSLPVEYMKYNHKPEESAKQHTTEIIDNDTGNVVPKSRLVLDQRKDNISNGSKERTITSVNRETYPHEFNKSQTRHTSTFILEEDERKFEPENQVPPQFTRKEETRFSVPIKGRRMPVGHILKSDNYRDYFGHFTNNETSVSRYAQQADDRDNYENRNENETPYQRTYITQIADDRERSNNSNDVTTNYQRYSTSNDTNRQGRNDVTVNVKRYSTSSDPNRQTRNMSYIDRSYLQPDVDMRRRHTRENSNDGSVILEIPRSYLNHDRYEIPVKSTYVDEPRDTMDDVYTGNAFAKRTYSYDVSNRPDESNTDIRIRNDDTNDNQLPQRRFKWQTQTRTSTQPSKLSGVISHVGSYRPDADTWRHKNDRLRPEFVEVQSTTVQIP